MLEIKELKEGRVECGVIDVKTKSTQVISQALGFILMYFPGFFKSMARCSTIIVGHTYSALSLTRNLKTLLPRNAYVKCLRINKQSLLVLR